MRSENVKVTMKIPAHFNEPDENGAIYSKEAWENAVKDAVGLPIEIINDDGSSTVVGVADEVKLTKDDDNEDIIFVSGTLWHGGTSENVEFTKDIITSVSLCSVGITR